MKIYAKYYPSVDKTYTFTESENGKYHCTSHLWDREITEQELLEAGYTEFHVSNVN